MNQTCLATLIRLLQFSKNCCKKQRGVLLFPGQGKRQFGSKWLNSHCVWRDSSVILCDVWTWVVKRTILEKENGNKRLSPNPSVTNLSLRPWCYLSTVTRSSSQGSVDDFRQERLQSWRPLICLTRSRWKLACSRLRDGDGKLYRCVQ